MAPSPAANDTGSSTAVTSKWYSRIKTELAAKLRLRSCREKRQRDSSALGDDATTTRRSSTNRTVVAPHDQGRHCPLGPQSTPRTRDSQSADSWLRNELGKPDSPRKRFGWAPWHHRDSNSSISSVGSSVREVLRGDTPPVTPMPLPVMVKSDCAKSVNVQFPGGEAVRINTPPLDQDTADGRPRGFFTCTSPPGIDPRPPLSTPASVRSASPRPGVRRSSLSAPSREWWEPMPGHLRDRTDLLSANVSSSLHWRLAAKSDFQFDVPEHLPSSPLCPANSRHASGGTGLCVYHGRKRTRSALRDYGE
ncbi:hypothetical protein CDD82_4802 [Ophiocordyceps australis]|uniref:Uncharacterized protein n=1 Tax=Ophiocordyceps australis TaxID=1399860 RepID=A0A2C5Y9J8_9HYPO|nr:hypothetical protein CDD82_4802 [Ophiocordyceps australis]